MKSLTAQKAVGLQYPACGAYGQVQIPSSALKVFPPFVKVEIRSVFYFHYFYFFFLHSKTFGVHTYDLFSLTIGASFTFPTTLSCFAVAAYPQYDAATAIVHNRDGVFRVI